MERPLPRPIHSPFDMSSPSAAIIGAGLSGALCAQQLSRAGWQVKVFEKSRGVGGRMATRRARMPGPDGVELTVEFDHGAPCFDSCTRSPAFASWLEQAQSAGVVTPWSPGTKTKPAVDTSPWVATPDMPALCRWLLNDQVVQTLCTVDGLRKVPGGWALTSSGHDVQAGFDAVVIAIPPAQAAALLGPHRGDWAALSQAQVMSPCWTLMAVTDDPVREASSTADQTQLAKNAGLLQIQPWNTTGPSPLAMVIRQDTKPGRAKLPGWAAWVAHTREDWTQVHLEASPEDVLPVLKTALQDVLAPGIGWHHAAVHRWRYAQFEGAAHTEQCLWDPGLNLGLCGDAWGQGGVAGAWESASGLCSLMLTR